MRFANSGELAARTEDDTLLPSDPYALNLSMPFADTFFEASCSPLHDLLEKVAPRVWKVNDDSDWDNGRPIIDLLSVDAEGAEVEIFRDFPFDVWEVHAIVVEVSRKTCMAVDSLLLPRGFIKVAVLGKDAVYAKPSLLQALPAGGVRLPKRIQWNEPGTDDDSIDYVRFQRHFGVDNNLDDDVGDQRLSNETELVRQGLRTEAKHNASIASLVEAASMSSFGGILTEQERKALEIPWVQDAMKDAEVKAALALLANAEDDLFKRQLASSQRLRTRIGDLYRAGAVLHPAAAEVARETSAGSSSPADVQ